MKTCAEEGCDKPYSAKGLCKPHYERKAYLAQREIRLARANARYLEKREQILESRRLISDARYAEMAAAQGGGCAICGAQPFGRKTRLCVDHCHTSGTIRGLLCDSCNRGIGLLGDDVSRLEKATAYLKGAAR